MEPIKAALFVAFVFILFARGTFGDGLITMQTGDDYIYGSTLFFVSRESYVAFHFKGCNDGHILLHDDKLEKLNTLYEIVIGGWRNSQSVIRKVKQGTKLAWASHSPVNCNEYRPFWISWLNGIISVGTGLIPIPSQVFMQFDDPNPTPVNYWSVATGWGATGSWIIGSSCVLRGDPHVATTSGLHYRVYTPGNYILLDSSTGSFKTMFKGCNTNKACLYMTDMLVEGAWVRLTRKNRIAVDAVTVTVPYNDTDMNIEDSPLQHYKFMIQFPSSVTVFWNGKINLRINLSMRYWENIKGLCGIFTDTPSNDFTLRDGTVTDDEAQFISDWMDII